MPRNEIPSASTAVGISRGPTGPATESLWAVDQRLGNAERELRVQFTRMAQLQAQLDVVLVHSDVRRREFKCDGRSRGTNYRPLGIRGREMVASLTRRGRTGS